MTDVSTTDAQAPAILDIDVISDVMCPWCFIGKRKLEQALAARPDVTADVRWRPFQLDPTIPEDGIDRKTYLDKKFGPDRAKEIYQSINDAGAENGIAFDFSKIEKSPNTLNAHRVIRWAVTTGSQGKVVERLFEGYFTEGADLTDTNYLAGVAEEAGMEREVVEKLLAGDADRELVEKEIALAQRMGVQGVPCFIFANKYVVMGAQDPEILVQAIDQARAGTEDEGEDESAPGSA